MTKKDEKAIRESIKVTIDLIDKDTFDKVLKDVHNNQVHIWSRRVPPDFPGRVIDWYDSLLQLVARISDGGDIITSPEVACIFESTLNFHMYVNDEVKSMFDVYTQTKLGTLTFQNTKTWTLYCDPYFKRNKILINPGLLNEQEIIVDHLVG